jgi:hypothetical protein
MYQCRLRSEAGDLMSAGRKAFRRNLTETGSGVQNRFGRYTTTEPGRLPVLLRIRCFGGVQGSII